MQETQVLSLGWEDPLEEEMTTHSSILTWEMTLVIANTLFQQHKRGLYTWTSPDGQHRNQIDYIFAAKDGERHSRILSK